jgi:hypothetical protein
MTHQMKNYRTIMNNFGHVGGKSGLLYNPIPASACKH